MSAEEFPLSAGHLHLLRGAAISDEVIQARGYRTVTDPGELELLGFAPVQRRVPGLLLPLHATDGGQPLFVYRPDSPRVFEDTRRWEPDGCGGRAHPCREIKYELPKGAGVRLDCPPTSRPSLGDPRVTLWITEGQKKADALASLGLTAIALLGVWNFSGRNALGGTTFLADWQYVALRGREVRIVFDSDVTRKRPVAQALERLAEHLRRKGASVAAVYLPAGPDGAKLGVDDWLAAGGSRAGLEGLVETPRPLPRAAEPRREILVEAPPVLARPLALIGGLAFAAAWLPVRTEWSEREGKNGEIVRCDPPQVEISRERFIIRGDGVIFGQGADRPLEALGFEIRLAEMPPAARLWSPAGVKAYRAGRRPDPLDVFARLTSVIDRFIDFDRSLAPQPVMAKAVALYVLSTWLLDAFNVAGFLWAAGDRGSGKTNLLLLVAELSYLGQVITSGGSFASLRDLADYGATLAFDDAENLSSARGVDPDKRTLLLAGNRRGVTVPFKMLGPDKTWQTVHVNVFCPRLFSATRRPDHILASRTIIIPLVRTPDRGRANSDPLDHRTWPHDQRALVDDLWALALSRLPEMPAWDEWVGQRSRLAGRALQPWRALLAGASWLDHLGAAGLWGEMEALALAYQAERQELETGDFTSLVIRALLDCAAARQPTGRPRFQGFEKDRAEPRRAGCAGCAGFAGLPGDTLEGNTDYWDLTTETITLTVDRLAREFEFETERVTKLRVGHALRKMRLTRPSREGGRGQHRWRVERRDLARWAAAYSLPLPPGLAAPFQPPQSAAGEESLSPLSLIKIKEDSPEAPAAVNSMQPEGDIPKQTGATGATGASGAPEDCAAPDGWEEEAPLEAYASGWLPEGFLEEEDLEGDEEEADDEMPELRPDV